MKQKDEAGFSKKKKKKTRHTHIVLPGEKPARKPHKERENPRFWQQVEQMQTPAAQEDEFYGEAPATEENTASGAAFPEKKKQQDTSAGRGNAIPMPKENPRIKTIRRKKKWRFVRVLIALALVAAVIFSVTTGVYSNLLLVANNFFEEAGIILRPGKGYPMDFAITGYKQSQSMGGGFAVLGEKDLAIVSQSGKELRRTQHGYVRPDISAGKNRVVVYSRGGRSYTVEGRTNTVLQATTEQDISFARMSGGGWLAVCTTNRNKSNLSVYKPTLTGSPVFSWTSNTDIPLDLTFHTDNNTMALSCLVPKSGALTSVIYVFKNNSSADKALLCEITAEVGVPVQMEFITRDILQVVYSSGYTAQYNTKGEQVARYDYGGRLLATSHTDKNTTAMVFGSEAEENMHLVLLDKNLQRLAEVSLAAVAQPQVLAVRDGVLLLAGQDVLAYSPAGEFLGDFSVEEHAYGLVSAKKPLLIEAGAVIALEGLFKQEAPQQADKTSSFLPVSGETAESETPAA